MKNNSNKIIIDLCGGSGAWSKPYANAGYTVHNITLPDYSVDKLATGCDGILFLSQSDKPNIQIWIEHIYGILAAPPCTEFSLAKTTAPRDFEEGMKTIRACLDIIWHCQTRGRLKFWALENPRGLLKRFLGKAPYQFEQWQFGGIVEKPTCIWGDFNPAKPTVTIKPKKDGRKINNTKHHANPKCPEEYRDYIEHQLPSNTNKVAAIRAITPKGFAEAFYKANR